MSSYTYLLPEQFEFLKWLGIHVPVLQDILNLNFDRPGERLGWCIYHQIPLLCLCHALCSVGMLKNSMIELDCLFNLFHRNALILLLLNLGEISYQLWYMGELSLPVDLRIREILCIGSWIGCILFADSFAYEIFTVIPGSDGGPDKPLKFSGQKN